MCNVTQVTDADIQEMNRLRRVCFDDAREKMDRAAEEAGRDWTPGQRRTLWHLAQVGAEKSGVWCGNTDAEVTAMDVTLSVENEYGDRVILMVQVQAHPPFSRTRTATAFVTMGPRGGLSYRDHNSRARARLHGKRKVYRAFFWGAF